MVPGIKRVPKQRTRRSAGPGRDCLPLKVSFSISEQFRSWGERHLAPFNGSLGWVCGGLPDTSLCFSGVSGKSGHVWPFTAQAVGAYLRHRARALLGQSKPKGRRSMHEDEHCELLAARQGPGRILFSCLAP